VFIVVSIGGWGGFNPELEPRALLNFNAATARRKAN
jgi:hypothetical protein